MPAGGYRWWYLDALSDDGRQGLTVIIFVGSVFSPYYARARRRGGASAECHNAFNVVLHGERRNRWCMTERAQSRLSRTRDSIRIGPSSATWRGDALELEIAERGCPLPQAILGRVRFTPQQRTQHAEALDTAEKHWWTPLAPQGRIEVTMQSPDMRWSGNAYLDSNHGSAPLEQAFHSWHWSRATTRNGSVVLYDVQRRDADELHLALRFNDNGETETIEGLEQGRLAASRWGLGRSTRSDAGHPPAVLQTLVDSPFYARSVIASHLLGERVTSIHESLSLTRFDSRWVQLMLPFRMPRQWWK